MKPRKPRTEPQWSAECFDTLRMLQILQRPAIAFLLADSGGRADLVGQWIWIEFPEKPTERVRRFLSAIGFRWNRSRECWQHSCGVPAVHTNGNPRYTYGSVPVSELGEKLAC